MYLCDVHTHTLISHDSRAPLEKQAEAAAAAGLSELCVTDHCDLLNSRGQPVTFFDWPAAKEQYRRVKAAFTGRLELRLGLELGSAPLDPAAARSILAEGGGELDFVLGSLQAMETQGVLDNASYSNGDLILNTFAYLTNKGDALNIRAKVISPESLTMTETQVKTLAIVLQYVLPLLRKAKTAYPEDADVLFILKYHIVSVVDSLDAAMQVYRPRP